MIGLVLVIAYLLRLISGRARQGLGERPQDNDQDLSGYSSDDEESNQFPDLEDNEQQSTLYHQTPITKPVSQGGYSRGYHTYLETSAASKLEQTDGWLSDDETTTSISTAEIEQGTYRRLTLAAVTSADDSDLYEDFKALWAKNQKQLNPKLRTTLYSIFRQRPDVYAFLLHCARKSSTRQSITKLVLSEFLQYKKTVREKESIPQPQLEHQLEALQICTRSHPIIFHDMCSIFDLDSAPHSNKMQLIKTLLRTNGKHKEAVTYARKLNLQKCFHLEEMLLPLVVMDKINIIESYVSADQELQFQFVKILDNLCASGSDLDGLASSYERAGISVGESSKLTRRQLNKLASRLAKTYGLDIEKFPNVAFSRASGSLHYMLSKYYKEGGISSDNMEDLIKASVLDNVQLQINLLLELIRYKDLPAAAYWAQYFNIDSRNIPFQLQDYMKHHPTVKRHKWQNNDSTDHHNDEYYCLNISLDQVHFIDNQGDLQHCQQTLCQQGNVIGVDAEWRLSACNAGVERIALLQLATKHAVYLLDMIALTADVSEEILRGFTASVFSSTDTIKLGYGIAGDFRVIAHSWPFVAEIVGTPCQVIDLQIFARSVKVAVEAKSGTNKKDTPPSHKSTSPTNTQEDLTTPSQCTSLNEAIVMRTFQKLDSIPDTELPSVPVSGDDVVGDDESNTEHSASSGPRGLGLLVKECFGRPLDKSQQLSDWERRPLKREQVYYAALDAYCLLEVYKHLKEKALAISPDFNITPFLTSSTAGKAVYKGQKEEKGAKRVKELYENPPKRTGPPIRPGDIKLVVDTMLQGLGRQLRSCGVDVVILTNNQHHYDAIKSCQQDGRVILTSGAPFNTLKGMVPEGMCVHVTPGKARDQALEVFDHLNIQVTPSDIFSRCQMCNSNNYVLIERSKMAEIFESLPETALNKCPLKLNGGEVREDDEVPTELRIARSSLLNNTNYPIVGLNDGLSICDGVNVVLSHNGVCLNIKNIPVGVLEHVDIFFCCSACGKVYWEGKHFERFVRTFHGVFNTASTT